MRRDEVFKAVEMSGPAYVPVYLFNRDQDQSDLVAFDVQHHFMGTNRDQSEWGFRWIRVDETMGQPEKPILLSLDNLKSLPVPNPNSPYRFEGIESFLAQYPDRFRMASLGITGFTTMWALRGFDQLMLDFTLQPNMVIEFAEIVFNFEMDIIKLLTKDKFDAVMFGDDWGTQDNLIISPKLWRKIFKPLYQKQFNLVHQLGLKVYFHCCGMFLDILPDFIEIGVDIMNISQPNLFDIPYIGKQFGGKVCFICPVSYQTTSITGTRQEIFSDVKKLIQHLGCYNGGLLGYVEEYHTVGMSEENYQACKEAFAVLGQYPLKF